MLSEAKRKQYTRALNRLEKCSGDCKNCKYCEIYIQSNIYAFGCGVLPKEDFTYMSDTMKDLRAECIEQLEFELK